VKLLLIGKDTVYNMFFNVMRYKFTSYLLIYLVSYVHQVKRYAAAYCLGLRVVMTVTG